ncbi:MAG: hypothetical protein AB1609_19845 [Bacillota bacterium]
MRRGQVVAAALVLCLVIAAAAAWSALSVADQAVRGSAWARSEESALRAARGALEWARWRLASDGAFLTLEQPSARETVPAVLGLQETAVGYVLETRARLARVSGPDLPVPPGLAAGLYAWVEDNFSPDGLSGPAPVPMGGLEPSWEVVPDPALPGNGAVEPPGLFRGGSPGRVAVWVSGLASAQASAPVSSCQYLPVEVGDYRVDPPLVRLSPRLSSADSARAVPFTAVVYGPAGARQAVPPEAVFELVSGPGLLEPQPWGVLYRPAGVGRVTVRVTVVEGEVTCQDEVSFDVVFPQRLCRVLPEVAGRPWGEAWLRDWGGQVSLESWDAGP